MAQYLPFETQKRIQAISSADLLVGIPSRNNAATIGGVISAVQYGLAKYFPRHRCVIVNSDGCSTDHTRLVAEQTTIYDQLDVLLIRHPVEQARSIATAYQGIPGKGSAFQAVFQIAEQLGVQACMVVDSDLRSISPEWVELLLGPVLHKGYDYVTPWYCRHKYDGTITNSLVYPLTRALYGKAIRQPIGGDFGLSRRLVQYLAHAPTFSPNACRFGIDIWMTTSALNEGFSVCQAVLGTKIHDPKDPAASLGPMFTQVVDTSFELMQYYENRWKAVNQVEAVPKYGFQCEMVPEPVSVNASAMQQRCREGWERHVPLWSRILPAQRLRQLDDALNHASGVKLSAQLWARAVYDFAVAHRNHPAETSEIVESMIPLYLGRVASFVEETASLSAQQTEEVVEQSCVEFERCKHYLMDRWFARHTRLPAPSVSQPGADIDP